MAQFKYFEALQDTEIDLDHAVEALGKDHILYAYIRALQELVQLQNKELNDANSSISYWSHKWTELANTAKEVKKFQELFEHKEQYYLYKLSKMRSAITVLSIAVGVLCGILLWS